MLTDSYSISQLWVYIAYLSLSETLCCLLQLKAKKEKQHAAQQNAQSHKQLEDARKANIEKMVSYHTLTILVVIADLSYECI